MITDQPSTSPQQSPNDFEQFMQWYAELRKQIEPPERGRNQHRTEAAALLGVCLAFFYVLLTLPKLTLPLHIALIAFALAAPSLLAQYSLALWARPKKGATDPFVLALWGVGSGLGIYLGGIFAAVGIGAVIWNLYPPAFWGLIGWAISITVLIPGVAALLVLRRAQRQQHAGFDAANSDEIDDENEDEGLNEADA